MREPLHQAIVAGASEVAVPTFLSTLCICIVFVPVFLLAGHGEIPVLSAVAVRHRLAAREPRALLHHGAGAVQPFDAPRGARVRRGTADSAEASAGAQESVGAVFKPDSSEDSSAFAKITATRLSWALSRGAADGDGFYRR